MSLIIESHEVKVTHGFRRAKEILEDEARWKVGREGGGRGARSGAGAGGVDRGRVGGCEGRSVDGRAGGASAKEILEGEAPWKVGRGAECRVGVGVVEVRSGAGLGSGSWRCGLGQGRVGVVEVWSGAGAEGA